MKLTIFGTGYVGLVTGACLAEIGNQVLCVDIDVEKIALLKAGHSPIFEPGLTEMLQRNIAANRIEFTTDAARGVSESELIFIAVGTPSTENGAADLRAIFAVAQTIGENLNDYALVLNKSTVPVGTADQVRATIDAALAKRNVNIEYDIASNPEFLREGAAINDFMQPDRIVIGADNKRAAEKLRELYTPLIDAGQRFIVMDTRSSELTKYASNAFLATKISFMNQMSHIAECLGADIEHVRRGMSLDPRIGEHFLYAGCGYGGSCFPKDVQALQKTASEMGYDADILNVVEAVNERQKRLLFDKLQRYFQNDLKGKVIAMWGLAFKPNTDDMRAASSLVLLELLWNAGAEVRVFDPIAMENTRSIFGERPDLHYSESATAALQGADTLMIVTEWPEFTQPDFHFIKSELRHPVIFDGRNIYDPQWVASHGLTYVGIGRGTSV
ncbi:MAG: UDP-glucose/GDP-mannose dehydrogenase family protein [Pseudomonadota bacterium]|nr:UDP-glucose/GDP-mannose dehydrogenase family protein [Pseudomonadota bacterium]